jgi:hypothetical protein
MLTELREDQATGEIAAIFAEIRHLYATPYVSSIHRHMATRPGVLAWAWEAAAPAFRSGEAQEAAWRIAAGAALPPLSPIPVEALAVWGVAPGDVATLAAVAESFTRVAPLNLVFGGIVRDLLRGLPALGADCAAAPAWTPPPLLPPPPAFADPAAMREADRRLLELFRSGSGATAFVPGLYRMLAHWPGLLAHLAVVLRPHLAGEQKVDVATGLLGAIDAAVADIRDRLPPTQRAQPDAGETTHLLRMIEGYRVTSPEMIFFGRLIREALP